MWKNLMLSKSASIYVYSKCDVPKYYRVSKTGTATLIEPEDGGLNDGVEAVVEESIEEMAKEVTEDCETNADLDKSRSRTKKMTRATPAARMREPE